MRLFALIALASLSLSLSSHGFVVQPSIPTRNVATPSLKMAVSTIYEGKPTERALSLDIRNEITKSSFNDVNGNSLTMDQLFSGRVSVVVFLRSLG
jgi:hypothetical protein